MHNEKRCGPCTFCCKVTAVPELRKKVGSWCKFCDPGKGCRIYEERPSSCRQFECVWFKEKEWPDWLRPDKSKVMFENLLGSGNSMAALCDKDRPDSWRKKDILEWVRKLNGKGISLIIGSPGVAPVVLSSSGRNKESVWQDVLEHVKQANLLG